MKKQYDRPKLLRPVKTLVIVTLSESFRIRPCLPFQVSLRFAKTDHAVGFEIPEYSRFSARVLEYHVEYQVEYLGTAVSRPYL